MGSIVWTKHALERNKERQITESWIEGTVNNPDDYSEIEGGKIKSQKKFGNHTVTVITARADSGKYLILSAWVNPPMPGTQDYRKESFQKSMKKSGGLGKFIHTLKNQLGF
jgi:hypothetical protein